jgi:hypothetical protein
VHGSGGCLEVGSQQLGSTASVLHAGCVLLYLNSVVQLFYDRIVGSPGVYQDDAADDVLGAVCGKVAPGACCYLQGCGKVPVPRGLQLSLWNMVAGPLEWCTAGCIVLFLEPLLFTLPNVTCHSGIDTLLGNVSVSWPAHFKHPRQPAWAVHVSKPQLPWKKWKP